jgi:DNA polymerase-3 subunit epsilon
LDTKELYSNLFPKLESYGLGKLISTFNLLPEVEQLAERFCPPSRRQFHAALFDAIASAVLLLNLQRYQELESHLTLPWLLTQSIAGSRKKQDARQAKLF